MKCKRLEVNEYTIKEIIADYYKVNVNNIRFCDDFSRNAADHTIEVLIENEAKSINM